MRSVRTVVVRKVVEEEYSGKEKPRHKIGDYVRVYCGSYEGHHFYVKDARHNADTQKFEYYYELFGVWYQEGTLVEGGSRKGWHYDSQGYCDNPGRGY